MNGFGDWFKEVDDEMYLLGLKREQTLLKKQTKFQDLEVFRATGFGNVMTLDGRVMLTEADEFVYHEMIAHIPALLHNCPRRVVVIGGGDGGTVRELLKHDQIEKITLCEIDGDVVSAAREYFPGVSCGFDDERVQVLIDDGIAYVNQLPEKSVDLMIIDSTDPIGPGEGLFTQEFYQRVSRVLDTKGLMVCQSESPWHKKELLQMVQRNLRGGFKNLYPYVGSVPTYPRGFWSWTIASNSQLDFDHIDLSRLSNFAGNLHYLTKDMVRASFVLPKFFIDKLDA